MAPPGRRQASGFTTCALRAAALITTPFADVRPVE